MIKLAERNFSFTEVFDFCSRATVVTDPTQADNPIVFANRAFTALTGYGRGDALGRNCRFLCGHDTDRTVSAEIREALIAGRSIRREILNYKKNGEAFWNDLTIDPVRDHAGDVVGFVGSLFDATSHHLARSAAIEAEQRLEDITKHLPGYVYRFIRKQGGPLEIQYISPSISRMLELNADELPTITVFDRCVHPDDNESLRRGRTQSASDLSMFREEFRLISRTGAVRWIRSDAQPRLLLNGDIVWDGIAIDITAEKTAQAELSYLAIHDPLTGLWNRAKFNDALSTTLVSASPRDHVAMFSIDLDLIQEVNDTFGRHVGDDVLRTVAKRLTDFTAGAAGRIARLGGDEFAVLLPASSSKWPIVDLAQRLSREIGRPMQIAGRELIVQACVGAVTFPFSTDPIQSEAPELSAELMKRADMALFAAKQEGSGSSRTYSAALDDRAGNRLVLRHALHEAISLNQFEMYYQPLVDLASGQIVGAEALIRWNHPELGLQRPDIFIPLAEASGAILPLGAWIIRDVMRQRQAWIAQGLTPPRIAINVSGIQLKQPSFIATVEDAMAATGADPNGFEFELTEGLLIEASPTTSTVLRHLQSMGFWVTIDDFGTGHSTFRYLRDFPADKIKVDQIFVRHLVLDSNDASIIRSMIALSRDLGIHIIAEGVETTMQRDFLRAEGCQVGQGYLFSLPLCAEDFGWLLERKVTLPTVTNLLLAT